MAMAGLKLQLYTFMVTFSGVCGGDLCQYVHDLCIFTPIHYILNTVSLIIVK